MDMPAGHMRVHCAQCLGATAPMFIAYRANIDELQIDRIIFHIDHVALHSTNIRCALLIWAFNVMHVWECRIEFRKFIQEDFPALIHFLLEIRL